MTSENTNETIITGFCDICGARETDSADTLIDLLGAPLLKFAVSIKVVINCIRFTRHSIRRVFR
jgi:hypothetical protein